MNNAYFHQIKEQIKTVLRKANKEVHVAMAWFTNEELLNELISCLNRKVKVRLILLDNPINWMPYAPDFNEFIHAGGQMYIADASVGFMHHKFCIIDGISVITGSYNWTHYAEVRNLENIIISDDVQLCNSYNKEFSRLLKKLRCIQEVEKISWEEVSSYSNIDFEEMNYEIKEISRVHHYEEVKVLPISSTEPLKERQKQVPKANDKSDTIIQIIENQKVFKSKYNIGIQTDDDEWLSFINIGEILPTTNSYEVFLDTRNASDCTLDICEKDGIHPFGRTIMKESLANIAKTSNLNSKIQMKVSLDRNGYLHIEITNKDNGKVLDGSLIEKDCVIVEE